MLENLIRKRLVRYHNNHNGLVKFEIPCKDQAEFEKELMAIGWNEVLQHNHVNKCCVEFMIYISRIVDKFIKCQKKSYRKIQLPWINDTIRQLLKLTLCLEDFS